MKEVWVKSPSFDFLSVSSWGRLLIDPTEAPLPNGGIRKYVTKPTYGTIQKVKEDYSRYVFTNRKRGINNKKVHQLVCEAFHGAKPTEDSVVMHIDDNPLNNNKDNLRWASQKENLNADKFIEYCKTRLGDLSPRKKRENESCLIGGSFYL